MKKYIYLFFISFSLSNCYTYKVKEESVDAKQGTKDHHAASESKGSKPDSSNEIQTISGSSVASSMDMRQAESPKSAKPTKNKTAIDITERLEPNKRYKINVADKSYKIQVDKWVSDSLVAHVVHHPKKILKFHKNQIDKSNIAERRFSQPIADILTVMVYAGIGVGIWMLVR